MFNVRFQLEHASFLFLQLLLPDLENMRIDITVVQVYIVCNETPSAVFGIQYVPVENFELIFMVENFI